MERIFRSRWFHHFVCLAIAASVLIVYSNTFNAAFQFDDVPRIAENESLKSLANIPAILQSPRGITLATFALNYAADGLDVVGYHIVNTAIHILASIAAYFFLFFTFRALDFDGAWPRKMAAFASLLFALHPVQTQSVTYIIQRMESLSSLFYLAALLSFIGAAKAGTPLRKWALYAGTGAFYALAFYSKETSFTLPAVIVLYDICFIAKGKLGEMARRWPVYALIAALFIFFAVKTVAPVGGFGDLSAESTVTEIKSLAELSQIQDKPEATAGFKASYYITPKEYLMTQFNVLVYYIAFLAIPANQNLDYDFPRAEGLFKWPTVHEGTALNIPVFAPAISLLILLSIIALAFYLLFRSWKNPGSKGRIAAFFIFWFFIILSPTSSFIPIIDFIYEHRLYLASLGYFTVFVLSVDYASGLVFGKKDA